MLSRKKPSVELFTDLDDQELVAQDRHEPLMPSSDSSSRVKTYSESNSLGIFRRGKKYDELFDDAASSSPRVPSPADTSCTTSEAMSDGEGVNRKRGAMGVEMIHQTSSGSLADGLLSRLNIKDKRSHMPMSYSNVGLGKEINGGSDHDIRSAAPLKSGSFKRGSTSHPGKPLAKPAAPVTRKPKVASGGAKHDSKGFELLTDKAGEELGSPRDSTRSRDMTPPAKTGGSFPITPNRTPDHATPIARSSPSLMSTAAKLAASLQQGSRRALTKKKSGETFTLMDDSATEASTDADSPDERAKAEDVGDALCAPRDSLSTSGRREPARSSRYADAASPGAVRPLLDSADRYDAASSSNSTPQPSPVLLYDPPAHGSPYQSAGTPPLKLAVPKLTLQNSASRYRPESASKLEDHSVHHKAPVEEVAEKAYDIFEPRPSAGEAGREDCNGTLPAASPKAASPSLTDLKCMNGHAALKALQKGTHLRKKWVSSTSASEAAQAPKTERFIRCRIEGSKVVLHYRHQGVKGFLDKDELVTHVQRVEVLDGPWRKGDCILLHTGKGVLALEAPDAATHATWMLGLNAALVSCQTRRKDVLLEAPVRAIPRNSMFVVTPPP